MKSLQETFAPHGRCFGCGPANDKGLRIRCVAAGDVSLPRFGGQSSYGAIAFT